MKAADDYLLYHYYKNGKYADAELIKVINLARKEAIEECAKIAKIKYICYGLDDSAAEDYVIDTESILDLIKELK